jgi:hypothetical protein
MVQEGFIQDSGGIQVGLRWGIKRGTRRLGKVQVVFRRGPGWVCSGGDHVGLRWGSFMVHVSSFGVHSGFRCGSSQAGIQVGCAEVGGV